MSEETNFGAVKSIIENGLCLRNSVLYVNHDMLINGDFEGKIYSAKKIYVEKDAKVKGEIAATELELKGNVSGNCYVKGHVTLLAGSRIDGKLYYGDITIESGAVLNGLSEQIQTSTFEKLVKSNKNFREIPMIQKAPVSSDAAPAFATAKK